MKSLITYIKESKEKERSYYINNSVDENDNYIIEGIELNYDNKTVKLNDSTEGVDFEGPIYWETKDKIDVISIFRRTPLNDKYDKNDGNPFIYALKNKYNWSFDITDREIRKYCRKFVENCQKLNRKFDTVIMIPSKSKLNERFMDEISNFVNADNELEDVFYKVSMTYEDVDDLIDFDLLKKDYKDNSEYMIALRAIRRALSEQNDIEGHNEFEAKLFPKEYLRYVKFLQSFRRKDYVDKISGKDIIILDDIYSSGETISKAVEAIKQNYEPKSITVVTLLSKILK